MFEKLKVLPEALRWKMREAVPPEPGVVT